MKDFSYQTRVTNIEKLKTENFDLVIIGGGITGAGVARDAAGRGLKVALIEANDFAEGTSSRSSKLVHGGIRYLENMEFHLVFEALSERTKLFEIAPHLVHPLRFMIPLYKTSRVGMFKMGLGMILYDALALFRSPQLHERLNAKETRQRMPIVQQEGLVGSFVYSDAYMDDARLVFETLRSAHEENAICVNYLKAKKSIFQNPEKQNKVSGIEVEDRLTEEKFIIRAKHVISTVGPWTDLVGEKLVSDWKNILRPTKGIHLTLKKDRLPLTSAVVMAAEKSSRIVFAIPRHEMIIIGTTDTDFNGDPDKAVVTQDDVTYLLKITNEYFPGAQLFEKDIISTYVGVRPLVKDDSSTEGKTSREHTILNDPRGFTFVAGGKYTTYRLMSEQIVDQVIDLEFSEKKAELKKCKTTEPLHPLVTLDSYQKAQKEVETGPATTAWLVERYGDEGFEILNKYGSEKSIWQLEAHQAIHTTMCFKLVDFYSLRVPLILAYEDHGLSVMIEVSEVFRNELNWSNEEVEKQKEEVKSYIKKEQAWKK